MVLLISESVDAEGALDGACTAFDDFTVVPKIMCLGDAIACVVCNCCVSHHGGVHKFLSAFVSHIHLLEPSIPYQEVECISSLLESEWGFLTTSISRMW